jgi:hypothetical protein
MNALTKRLERIKAEIRKRDTEFWEQFSDNELEALSQGNSDAMAKFDRMGGVEIFALKWAIMTPDELAELEQIAKELKLGEVSNDPQSTNSKT